MRTSLNVTGANCQRSICTGLTAESGRVSSDRPASQEVALTNHRQKPKDPITQEQCGDRHPTLFHVEDLGEFDL